METKKSNYEYFKLRRPGKTYVSKPFKGFKEENLRILYKIIDTKGNSKLKLDQDSNYFVYSYEDDESIFSTQIKVVIFEEENALKQVILQNFSSGRPYSSSITFHSNELAELVKFLHDIQLIDFTNKHNFKVYDKNQTIVAVDSKEKELLDYFKNIKGDNRIELLDILKGQNFSKSDLDILSGRRDSLETFNKKLNIDKDWSELDWQKFFEQNTWIFGYGLDYKFLKILQREANLSNVDLDGSNSVKGDYLLGSNKFTVLVELKRPDTPLVKLIKNNEESGKNRSDSWRLSDELTYSISQILAQKSNWELKSQTNTNFTNDGSELLQDTYDPKSILIIGNLKDIGGTERTKKIKEKTFELFRRNSRNIEIVTFDELYERAYYLVNQKELNK